jgi:hypothetical protein
MRSEGPAARRMRVIRCVERCCRLSIPVLLVTSEAQWIGPARMPASLHRAGFEVTLLAPANALAQRSRFVTRSGVLPDGANSHDWIFALVAAIRASRPKIVLPGDEMTLRLLQTIVLTPPPGLRPDVSLELAELITSSLGPPKFYESGADKALLQPLLERAGIAVPEYRLVQTEDEAERATRALGPQTVVKPIYGTGGHGVVFCATAHEAASAFRRAFESVESRPPRLSRRGVLMQRRIDGTMIARASVAHRGVELAGFARERLRALAPTRGATMVRYARNSQLAELSRTLARTLEITGFFAMEYCVERTTGKAYAIDLARRLVPAHHTGHLVGMDLCAALAAALRGEAVEPGDLPEGFSHVMTCFPQEYWRDPQSTALNEYPTDAPWDDPDLMRALLEWRYDPDV